MLQLLMHQAGGVTMRFPIKTTYGWAESGIGDKFILFLPCLVAMNYNGFFVRVGTVATGGAIRTLKQQHFIETVMISIVYTFTN